MIVILPIQVLWKLNSIQLNSVFPKTLSSFAVIMFKVIFLRENLLKSQSMLHIDNLWFGQHLEIHSCPVAEDSPASSAFHSPVIEARGLKSRLKISIFTVPIPVLARKVTDNIYPSEIYY